MITQKLIHFFLRKSVMSFSLRSQYGGNPREVTLGGFSSGAAMAHLHMMSPLSKGMAHLHMMFQLSKCKLGIKTYNSIPNY